jgi:hypothetical protein
VDLKECIGSAKEFLDEDGNGGADGRVDVDLKLVCFVSFFLFLFRFIKEAYIV